MKSYLTIFSLFLLTVSSCSTSFSSSLDDSSNASIAEESSSLSVSSDSSSLTNDSIESSSIIEESKSNEKESSYLEIISSSIEPTLSGNLLTNYDFAVEDSLHRSFSFHAEEIKRGEGSHEGTIQSRANKDDGRAISSIVSKEKLYGNVTFIQRSNGQYNGTPSFYNGVDSNSFSKVEPKIENVDSNIKYTFEIDGYFKYENLSKNAIYFSLLSFSF